MPMLRALAGKRAITKTSLSSSDALDSIVEPPSATGKTVTPEQSLRVSAVYAGVRLLAESISSLPMQLIERQGKHSKARDGDLADLLTVQPNPEQDAPELWRTVMGWMLLEGNAYVYVERNGDGTPIGLWPLPSTSVQIGRTPGRQLYYDIQLQEDDPDIGLPRVARVGQTSVLHFKAFGTGLYGLSPIRQVREAVATSLSAQEYMGRFYQQDASPGGILTTDGNLTDEQFERLNKQWKETHSGVSRSHLMAIMEGGMRWESVGLNPDDAAFIETQKWETVEIARALGVPPHMIGDVEKSTSWGSGIAEQGIGFVTYTLTPWINRLEWVVRRGVLRDIDRNLRMKWRVDGLQRGDVKSRYEGYAQARQWGWLSTNDIRSMEDMDPVEGGDVYLQPLNMVEAGTGSGGASAPDSETEAEPERGRRVRRSSEVRSRTANSFAPLIANEDERVARMERSEVDKLIKAHLDDGQRSQRSFMEAVRSLYEGRITERSIERFGPIFASLASEITAEAIGEIGMDSPPDLSRWVERYTASHIGYRVSRSVAKLGREAQSGPSAVRSLLEQWVTERPEATGRWESAQLSRAAARETWRDAGVREIRWNAMGDMCEICQRLDGTVVGIEQPFAQKGDKYPGGEGQNDLTVGRSTFHPPVHPGCQCDIEVST